LGKIKWWRQKILAGNRRKTRAEARYVKEVNDIEETIKFYQEVYDNKGKLVEIHEKFPLDKGHRDVGG